MFKGIGQALLAIASVHVLAACQVQGFTVTPTGQPAQAQPSKAPSDPVIQVFTSNPSTAGTWEQAFTFQIEAYSPDNGTLKYNWSATGGTLSGTSGKLVSWTPPKKAGTYTVQVSVIDIASGGQAASSANITISDTGAVSITK